MLFVAVAEFINPSGGIDKFHLTGIEGVGSSGDFQLYQRVFHAIDFDGFPGFCTGAGDEIVFRTHIFEYAGTVILGVDVFLHDLQFVG